MNQVTIRLKVNGREIEEQLSPEVLLVDFLRERLGLIGTKECCGVGVCGACSVLLDDQTVSSCLLPAVVADGREVWTIEGLAAHPGTGGRLDNGQGLAAVQEAFMAQEGFQCGMCTSGQIVSAFALLLRDPHPSRDQILDWMSGNLCRCTGYQSILRSIRAAAGEEVEDAHASL